MDCSKTGIIFHHRAEFKHNLSELQTYHRTDGSLSANVSDIALTAQLEENNEPWVSNMGLSESSAVVFLSPGGLVGSKMASLGPIIARIALLVHLLKGLLPGMPVFAPPARARLAAKTSERNKTTTSINQSMAIYPVSSR